MSAHDGFPSTVYPYSNGRPAIYLSVDNLRIGSDGYLRTLAHELEHALHWTANPGQEGWLEEGLAELASGLITGSSGGSADSFRVHPETQLTSWSEKPWEASTHYQASYLWARYLVERGDAGAFARIVRSGGQGWETIQRYATQLGIDGGATGLFRDWLVANLVNDTRLADGRYGYHGLSLPPLTVQPLTPGGGSVSASVSQFGASYFELASASESVLKVTVQPTVQLIPSTSVDGAMFWSERGDNRASSLTRWFDLSGVQSATLTYRAWYELEPDYDYCYVLASRDGAQWQALVTSRTQNPAQSGAALGPGITGRADDWISDHTDLSQFAGGPAAVRFQCVTDQSYSSHGLALDDIAIPELGFVDNADQDTGWITDGFVRAPNAMSANPLLLEVEVGSSGIVVNRLTPDGSGFAQLAIGAGSGDTRRYAIVSGLAPRTLLPESFTIELAR
jgi:hypothetical protein